MSTFTQIYYHLVFATKNREPVLEKPGREEFFRYVWGIIRNKSCHLYRINAVADHVHILTSMHPTVAFADFVKDIKVASNEWIKAKRIFPRFTAWQEGYGAFTAAHADKDRLIDYIIGQEAHHQAVSFLDEYRRLLDEAGVKFDEKYLA